MMRRDFKRVKAPCGRYRYDLRGEKFTRLAPLQYYPRGDKKKYCSSWLCLCDCGKKVIVPTEHLLKNNTLSCGCRFQDELKKRATHKKSGSRIYLSWAHMIQRCTNKNDKNYVNYGDRGIAVCDRWMKFENFYEDMGEMPPKLTLGRIDNNGGYFKRNCRWETMAQQMSNTRRSLKNRAEFDAFQKEGEKEKSK